MSGRAGAEHAFLEGEGGRPLDYWRRVHMEYFTEELGATPSPQGRRPSRPRSESCGFAPCIGILRRFRPRLAPQSCRHSVQFHV